MFARKIRAAFAACTLGNWPTPLEAAPALARALGLQALWLKREDHAGGNKVRGLEFVFGGVPPRSTFVTIGGTGSTHCLSTARLARVQGHRTAVAVFAQPETEDSRRMAVRIGEAADVVVRARSVLTLPWAVLRAWRAARRLGAVRPRWIPGGAAEPRAVLGHVLGALELEMQIDAPPDAIVVPLGTGGTAAGIALGVAWLGWPTEVIGARVAPRVVANHWRTLRLAHGAVTLLRRAGIEWEVPLAVRLRVVNAMGAGYGHPTHEGELARALAAQHGVRLDPTYGAKAFATLLSRGGQMRRVVFWHTFPSY